MPFTHTTRGIARLNRTSKLARRENVGEAADNAERPRSPGPARAAAGRQGPRTAAKRTGSSNPARFFCDINDLLAEGVGFEPTVLSRVQRFSSLMAAMLPRIGPV